MSALGQERTCALRHAMSALPLIATVKADIRKTSCLLYPQKRTCAAQEPMSALGQKRTSCQLFDHLIGAFKQWLRHRHTHGLRGLEINHKFVLSRRLHR